ncbi:MAG: hypothetical protein ACTS5F_00690 [Candidatus Hodgkinia cicadicola]
MAIQASKPVTRTPWYKCATRCTQRTASSPPSYTSQPRWNERNGVRIKFAPSSAANINCIHEPTFVGLVKRFVTPKANMCELVFSVGRMFALPQLGTEAKCLSLKAEVDPKGQSDSFAQSKFKCLCEGTKWRDRGGGREWIDLMRSRWWSSLEERYALPLFASLHAAAVVKTLSCFALYPPQWWYPVPLTKAACQCQRGS